MFKLRKLHPPLGTRDAPIIEASYSEGAIAVVDGRCEVRLPETRDRLLKLGYADAAESPAPEPQPAPKAKPTKRGRR